MSGVVLEAPVSETSAREATASPRPHPFQAVFGAVRESMRAGWSAWCRFWFEAEFEQQMRLFRRLVAWLLLFAYVQRSLDLELYFSDAGIAPLAILPEVMDLRFRHSLFGLLPSTGALWALNGVFLLSLLALAMGWAPRLAAIVALMIHVSFLHRNMAAAYGADTLSTFFFLYFCLADFRRKDAATAVDFRSILGSVAFRLCQIQICIVYFYSGLHKFKGAYWWRGEAIWGVLANSQLARFDFSWAAHFPLFFVLGTYATLLFEIYFPALIWLRPARKPLLFFGFMMHLGIGIAMNIAIFATLMIFTYSLFLDRDAAARLNRVLERAKLSFN